MLWGRAGVGRADYQGGQTPGPIASCSPSHTAASSSHSIPPLHHCVSAQLPLAQMPICWLAVRVAAAAGMCGWTSLRKGGKARWVCLESQALKLGSCQSRCLAPGTPTGGGAQTTHTALNSHKGYFQGLPHRAGLCPPSVSLSRKGPFDLFFCWYLYVELGLGHFPPVGSDHLTFNLGLHYHPALATHQHFLS